MAEPDRIDALVGQWKAERPDLDLEVMATAARLMRVGELLAGGIHAMAAEYELTRGEGDVLFTLRRAGSPYRLPPSRLSQSLLVAPGTMTNRLDRLEARGLIKRIPNPQDRRSLDIELTPKGRRLVDEAVTRHVDNEARMLAGLGAREREQLDRLNRKLLAHLEAG
jgi:DNA-binding MarR family transcriptional regulator